MTSVLRTIENVAPEWTRPRTRPSYKVVVVLPMFNEEANIGRLLESIDTHLGDTFVPYRVVVIDDGSSDRSAEIVVGRSLEQPIDLYRHAVNQGLGATLRDGLKQATAIAGDADIVVTMDADESHTPGLIPQMISMIREGHDVVIGSRYQRGSVVAGVPWHRRAISWIASCLFRLIFPTRGVRDYTCGYRAYRGSVLKAAAAKYGDRFVDQEGFQCMVDVLLKLRRMDVIFGEVPMILRYDLKKGTSKMRLVRTAYNTLRLMWARRVRPA